MSTDGKVKCFNILSFPIKDNAGDIYQITAVIIDITERRQREEELKKFKFISDHANDAHFLVDRHGKFHYVNETACRMMGYSEEALLSLGVPDVDIVYGIEKYRELFDQIQKEKIPPIQTVNKRKDGTVFCSEITVTGYRINGELYMFAALRDITVRKEAEEALIRSETRFKQVVENAREWVWEVDPKGVYTYASPVVKQILGYEPEEIVGKKHFFDLFHPEDIEITRELAFKYFTERKPFHNFLNRNVHKNKKPVWLLTSGVPILDEKEDLLGYRGVDTDITELKRSEERVKVSLKEKELLLKEIHHRVKNNMAVIQSFLQLQSRYVKEERYRNMFLESVTRINSMARIHEKLYRSGDLSKIQFDDYIREMVDSMYMSYGLDPRKVILKKEVEKVVLGIDAAIPCGLIVNELVSNSLKHAFPEGKEGEIKVVLRINAKNEVELTVRDNGMGMPKDLDLSKTDSLGLTLVNALTMQLKGSIELKREEGTEFRISFKRSA
jgi:PAS domain S-box-containing protein